MNLMNLTKLHLRILLLLLAPLTAALGQNVKVSDYKVPVSRATNLRVNGFWNWSQVGDTVASNTANATVVFRKFFSSLPFAWDMTVDAKGGKEIGKYNHDLKFTGTVNKYIWNDRDWFASSGLSMQHNNTYKQVATNVNVGAGYGRFIDATPLAKAVRIEEHMLREGIITERLPKETMINIANIIGRQDEYINLYGDTYDTHWLDDIDRELRYSGMLVSGSIGSVGVLRIRQVLFANEFEKVNPRYYGWDVTGGILFRLTTRDKSDPGDPNFSLRGHYSVPVSWRMQINTVAEIFSPMDETFAKEVTMAASVDFIYELSNRINFVGTYRYDLYNPYKGRTRNDNRLNGTFLFYIENSVYLGVNATYEKFSGSPKILSSAITLSYNVF